MKITKAERKKFRVTNKVKKVSPKLLQELVARIASIH